MNSDLKPVNGTSTQPSLEKSVKRKNDDPVTTTACLTLQGTPAANPETIQGKISQNLKEPLNIQSEVITDVAFNALEKFVHIFSKTKAETMRAKRLQSLINKFQNAIIDKNEKNISSIGMHLANISINAFTEVINKSDNPTNLINKFSTKLSPNRLAEVLKKFPPKTHSEINRTISLALGRAILTPQSTQDPKSDYITSINQWTSKTERKPGNVGEDLWRTMPRLKIYQEGKNKPILDGSTISKENKDEECSIHMRRALNIFFQHGTQTKDIFLEEANQGTSQNQAHTIGIKFKETLKNKELNNDISKKVLRLFSLGAQELFTQPGTFAMPVKYKIQDKGFKIGELRNDPQTANALRPFEYNRAIAIHLMQNGSVEYIVTQPISILEPPENEAIGLCLIETKIVFDAAINCVSIAQEVKPALIQHTEKTNPEGV